MARTAKPYTRALNAFHREVRAIDTDVTLDMVIHDELFDELWAETDYGVACQVTGKASILFGIARLERANPFSPDRLNKMRLETAVRDSLPVRGYKAIKKRNSVRKPPIIDRAARERIKAENEVRRDLGPIPEVYVGS